MTVQSSFGIASQGLTAAAERLKVHANNIANTQTPNFVRKIPVLMEVGQSSFDHLLGQVRSSGVFKAAISNAPGGVEMAGTIEDPTPGKKIYDPGHPEADADGYVTMSNVNVVSDMADAMVSSRLYEANLAVIGIVKAMANRALEIGRGQ